jgi:hypothetical protein
MPMNYSELIQLYFERSNALQWYWTLYVVIVGGLLAFSSLRVRRDLLTSALITILFCCFAYKNLGAIQDTMAQRSAALQAIQQMPGSNSNTAGILPQRVLVEAAEDHGVRNFHVASDILTIAAVWAMELRRARQARKEPN